MAIVGRVARAAGVRAGEALPVSLVAAVFASLEAGRGFGEVGANTLVLARLGADALPWLYIPLGLLSLAIAIVYGTALGRVRRGRLFVTTLVAIGGALAIEWLGLSAGLDLVPVTWLTVMAAGSIAITIGWTAAGSTLDARQAKRLFPLFTAAAIAGNFTGSLLAGPVASALGAATLVVAEASLFALAGVVVLVLAARSDAPGWAPRPTTSRSMGREVLAGFELVRRSPLLGLVAIAYVLLAVLLFSVTFPFQRVAVATYPDEAELARVLGLVAATVAGAAFVISLAAANRFYARFGVATAALALPLVYLAGFGLWIVAFSFATATLVTIVQQVTQRGLSNAAWSAIYNVTPSRGRAQAMAFIDGVPGQLGIVLSGVLLLTAGRLLAPAQVFWMGLVAAAICTVVVLMIRRRYAQALLHTLRSGTGEQVLEGGAGLGVLVDAPDVQASLLAGLADPDASTRRLAASLLARSPAPEAQRAVAGALDDADPGVRAEAIIAILARPDGAASDGTVVPRQAAETALGLLLSGPEPELVAGLMALDRLDRIPSPTLRATALTHPSPAVRAMAVAGLRKSDDEAADATLCDALDDPSPVVRRAAATAVSLRPSLPEGLIDRLERADDRSIDAILLALEGHGAEVREPVLRWADRQVDTALRFDVALDGLAADGDAAEPTTAFLCDTLRARVVRHQDLALAAMSVLGAPEARGTIRRCLRSRDPEIRAQAIEALDSVGDRGLGGSIARLVEQPPESVVARRDTVLRALRDDVDPWVAGLATAVMARGGTMPRSTELLGDLERMLELRRVPLFRGLSPEDLQRLAGVAEERDFGPGEDLVREGELGRELFVILEGRVVVHRREPDGTDRVVRTYESGDHIGELAVLRERPRAATVTADDGTVRTLVIDGDGLTAILEERPAAAMALLATLAERISSQ